MTAKDAIGDGDSCVGERQEAVSFESLGLVKSLCDACVELGYTSPTPIQAQAIPFALNNRDIIGLAQTGSGKTVAFALPILQALLKNPQPLFACILSPTRELAVQIADQCEALGASIGVRCAVVVGGIDMISQAIALAKRPHIIVGTPGRLLDHLENTRGFALPKLKYLVLDEADRLLNMDFGPEIDKILAALPKEGRRTFLFSATMTSKVAKLQRASLIDPVKVEVSSKYATVDTLLQYYVFLPAKLKDCYFVYLLNEMAGSSMIVFVSTCATAQRLAFMVRSLGFNAIPLHGQLPQAQRLGALSKFKAGSRTIMIATDVASRGLDIPQVDCVINYDVPANSKDYVHRVGRTARAGRSGKSISLVTQYDVELYQRIEHLLGKKLPAYPVPKEAVAILQQRVHEAQRFAAQQIREEQEKESSKKDRRNTKLFVDSDSIRTEYEE